MLARFSKLKFNKNRIKTQMKHSKGVTTHNLLRFCINSIQVTFFPKFLLVHPMGLKSWIFKT